MIQLIQYCQLINISSPPYREFDELIIRKATLLISHAKRFDVRDKLTKSWQPRNLAILSRVSLLMTTVSNAELTFSENFNLLITRRLGRCTLFVVATSACCFFFPFLLPLLVGLLRLLSHYSIL